MKGSISGRLAGLLAVVVTLVVLIVGWLALVSPQRSRAADVQTQVDKAQAQLQATQAYLNDPANRQRKRDLARLQQILPDTVRVSKVLRQLSTVSAEAGVRIDSITPQVATAVGPGDAIPISLNVEGHYFGLSKFLHILRSKVQISQGKVVGNGFLYSVGDITFSGSGATQGGSPGTVLSATLTLNVFDATPPAAPTTSTDTTGTTTTTGQ